jgi:uncharacterized protein (TIRG00374 family)
MLLYEDWDTRCLEDMPLNLKTMIKLLLSLGLTAVFLWAAFRSVDLSLLWGTMSKADPFWLLTCAFLFILAVLPRAWRWQILLRPVASDITLWRISVATLIAYAGNNVFPRAGEIARVMEIKRGRDLSLSAILATVLVERVIDLIALLTLFGAVLFTLREEIGKVFPWMEGVAILAFAGSLLLLVLFGLLSSYGDRALTLVKTWVGKLSQKLAGRLVEILKALFQGLGSVRGTSGYAGILTSSILLNLIYILATYVIFLSFNFSTHQFGIQDALVIMVISTVGVIIPTPGGTGTYHYFCSQALHRLYDIPLAEALAFATVVHGIVFITYLIAGGPSLLRLIFQSKLSNSN